LFDQAIRATFSNSATLFDQAIRATFGDTASLFDQAIRATFSNTATLFDQAIRATFSDTASLFDQAIRATFGDTASAFDQAIRTTFSYGFQRLGNFGSAGARFGRQVLLGRWQGESVGGQKGQGQGQQMAFHDFGAPLGGWKVGTEPMLRRVTPERSSYG
jgi:hypothetical protein